MASASCDASLRSCWCHSTAQTSASPNVLSRQEKVCKGLQSFISSVTVVTAGTPLNLSSSDGRKTAAAGTRCGRPCLLQGHWWILAPIQAHNSCGGLCQAFLSSPLYSARRGRQGAGKEAARRGCGRGLRTSHLQGGAARGRRPITTASLGRPLQPHPQPRLPSHLLGSRTQSESSRPASVAAASSSGSSIAAMAPLPGTPRAPRPVTMVTSLRPPIPAACVARLANPLPPAASQSERPPGLLGCRSAGTATRLTARADGTCRPGNGSPPPALPARGRPRSFPTPQGTPGPCRSPRFSTRTGGAPGLPRPSAPGWAPLHPPEHVRCLPTPQVKPGALSPRRWASAQALSTGQGGGT